MGHSRMRIDHLMDLVSSHAPYPSKMHSFMTSYLLFVLFVLLAQLLSCSSRPLPLQAAQMQQQESSSFLAGDDANDYASPLSSLASPLTSQHRIKKRFIEEEEKTKKKKTDIFAGLDMDELMKDKTFNELFKRKLNDPEFKRTFVIDPNRGSLKNVFIEGKETSDKVIAHAKLMLEKKNKQNSGFFGSVGRFFDGVSNLNKDFAPLFNNFESMAANFDQTEKDKANAYLIKHLPAKIQALEQLKAEYIAAYNKTPPAPSLMESFQQTHIASIIFLGGAIVFLAIIFALLYIKRYRKSQAAKKGKSKEKSGSNTVEKELKELQEQFKVEEDEEEEEEDEEREDQEHGQRERGQQERGQQEQRGQQDRGKRDRGHQDRGQQDRGGHERKKKKRKEKKRDKKKPTEKRKKKKKK